ncbi:hypothetical protein V502_11371 [Pseudogymnoascus sp. VKM F-4520 (FW-2644)]|nr:hypothetical protein V502_11371 [Pseudogymnoascus sp. VKM F-4520 (FW-2644)]
MLNLRYSLGRYWTREADLYASKIGKARPVLKVFSPALLAPANWELEIKCATSITKKLHELRAANILNP